MRGLAWSTLFGLVLALLLVVFAGALIFGADPNMIAEHSICSNTGTALRMFSYFDGVTVASADDTTGIMDLCKPRLVSVHERASDEVVNRRIGDELVICQNSFGGGQVNLFRDEARGSLTRYCGLCAKVDFEEDLPPEGQEQYVEGFEEHLVTYVVPGTEKTIGQILNSDLPQVDELERIETGELPETAFADGSSLVRGEDLAVIYIYDKQASRLRNSFEAIGYGAMRGLGVGETGKRTGRAIVARIGGRAAGRAAGWVFGGPVMFLAESGTVGYSIFSAFTNEELYTDDWVGGVVMIPWDSLFVDGSVEDDSEQALSSVLGCQQPINFVQGDT